MLRFEDLTIKMIRDVEYLDCFKESSFFKIHSFIKEFFSINLETNFDDLSKKYINKIGHNLDEKYNDYDLLSFFAEIRPKYWNFLIHNLIPKLLLKSTNSIKKSMHISSEKYLIQKVFKKLINENISIETSQKYQILETIYPIDSIEYFIKEDDITMFMNYLANNVTLNLNNLLDSNHQYSFNFIPSPKRILPISLSVFYGSIKIFKYLIMNEACLQENTPIYATAGGNRDIIQLIIQQGGNFDNVFYFSVIHHRYDLSDWLLLNYECEKIPLSCCLTSFSYDAFVFLVINKKCKEELNELILPISKGNYGLKLMKYKTKHKIQTCLLKCLVENGAEFHYKNQENSTFNHLNKEELKNDKIKISLTINPICYLIENESNMKAIQYLIDKGYDVNFGCPLFLACKYGSYKLIKLLIKNGADVNQTIIVDNKYGTSVADLAKSGKYNDKITKLILKYS